jgi:putative transposase
MLVAADGAPGLIKAVEQCWPASDRQHCTVQRVRNLLAKLPERVRQTYWRALDEAINERDGKQRLHAPEWERMFAIMDAATGEREC